MENQECKDDGKKGCCCGKAAMFVLTLLVGGIIGYLMGHRCHCPRMSCPMHMEMPAAPMPPAKGK